jgi:hypothetical protein
MVGDVKYSYWLPQTCSMLLVNPNFYEIITRKSHNSLIVPSILLRGTALHLSFRKLIKFTPYSRKFRFFTAPSNSQKPVKKQLSNQ